MTTLVINELLLYCFLMWGSNILLNFLGALKIYFPIIKNFDKPIDFRVSYNNKRLVGESTTFIGLIVCSILSIIIYIAFTDNKWSYIPLLVYFGHTFGSIFKRRLNKRGGEFMPFVDHGDYTITTGIFLH